ncbi:condensation domain-containing protein [Dactylosporangium sp. NBC_01737]|uniref:condensation domain-containing protein n=1 Tax=Dactylosporangium sp. NBC_01737 TaxID=2975959 RepID=UPI002E0EF7A1|nr:condensation domain-containing protein [Dactylosporangium sp. NBC_01737]
MRAPVTPAQQRLWFLAQVDPEALDYHIPLAYRLRGPLDTTALAGAVGDVVARHGALRTRFPLDGDGPVQEVLDGWRPDVAVRDSTAAAAGAQVAVLANTPFDLTAAPPMRAAILRLDTDEHILVLVLHHILADAWSVGLLREELAKAYTAHVAGTPCDLPALPTQYAEHARAARPDGSGTLAYWADRLAGAPVLELPTDRPRPARRGTAGTFDGFELGPDRAADLRTLGRAGRTTPFMTLLAAYLALLGLATGQDDISVGTPVSGRDRTDVEPLIGYFLDTVVLRGDLTGDPTFRDLLARVKATALEAYQHRDVPFEDLIARLDVRRDPARTPLFDTMLIVHSGAEDHGLALPGITAEYYDPGHRSVKFDLTFECFAGGGELKVVAHARRDLFDPASTAALVHRFGELLRLAAEDPGARLSTLYIRLTEAEHGPWRCAGPAATGSVLDLVDFGSAAPAVVHGDTTVSYVDLDARARRLAADLDGHGGLVGVQLPPGVDLVVALLAAWRAGAGYLPLDPDAPPRRTTDQIDDSGAGIVVTAGGIRRTGASTAAGPLAYAMYTSGSTGRPKAVAVPHTALAVRVRWMRDRYDLTAADRVLQFASPSFDTFGEEVYPCLAAGATLVIPTGARAELPDFLATEQGRSVTVLDLPTSYWHELCADPAAVPWPPGLRLLILGGEQVRPDALERWFAHVGDRVEVLNTYGPTEATIIATAARLTPADTTGRPPIGHPIGDTCAHVTGLGGAPVPDGVAGELVLGGPGIADGYLGRSTQRFADVGGVRHYRTGDRARRRPDGALEFLGRVDEQLKVRGYRVEPGEVEAALLTHPSVGHAVVTADGDGRLVAHLVPAPGATVPGPAALRAHLAELLPQYLHPRAYATLDRLPMTRNGKVDRAALPPVAAAAGEGRPPAGDAELLVAEVWQDVLGVEGIRADDDFFDLGGHSLLATRVTARLRASAGIEVPLRTVFHHTTVAALAVAVEELLLAEIDALDDDEVRRLLTEEAGR